MDKSVEGVGADECLLVAPSIGIDFAQPGTGRGAGFVFLPGRPFASQEFLARHANSVIATEQPLAMGWSGEPRVRSERFSAAHSSNLTSD